MKKVILACAILALIGVVAYGGMVKDTPQPVLMGQADCTRPLMAGQYINVGEVRLQWNGDDLTVTYDTSGSGWQILEVHFGWGTQVPGQLQYKAEGLSTTEYTLTAYNVPYDIAKFAAHAVVQECFNNETKDAVMIRWNPTRIKLEDYVSVTPFLEGSRSKYRVEIQSSNPEGTLNGNGFNGWCLDEDLELREGYTYNARVITDWSELEGLVHSPQNMRYVEALVRANIVGNKVFCDQIVTRDNVQNVIWHLIDGKPRSELNCAERTIVGFASRMAAAKTMNGCLGTYQIIVLEPIYEDGIPDFEVQPLLIDILGEVECPEPTPTKTPTPYRTRTATPPPTMTPTPTATPTPPVCPTCPPGPTCTPPPPTATPTMTPTNPPESTPTPTVTATPTTPPCNGRTETAWGFGEDEFPTKWGWYIYCPR